MGQMLQKNTVFVCGKNIEIIDVDENTIRVDGVGTCKSVGQLNIKHLIDVIIKSKQFE